MFENFNIHPTFRKYQRETIEKIVSLLEQGTKFIILEAPTGIGKSVIAYIVAKYFEAKNKSVFISTSLNMLLDQYENEFSSNGLLPIVKGADNYDCKIIPHRTCAEAPCYGNINHNFSCASFCDYKNAKKNAVKSTVTLSNLHFWLSMFDTKMLFEKRDLLICDEAHDVEQIIMQYAIIHLDSSIADRFNRLVKHIQTKDEEVWNHCKQTIDVTTLEKLDFDDILKNADYNNITNELKHIHDIITNVVSLLDNVISEKYAQLKAKNFTEKHILSQMGSSGYLKATKEKTYFTRLNDRISNYFTNLNSTIWVTDIKMIKKKINEIDIKPVFVDYLVKSLLLEMANQIVFMSATIGDKHRFCKNLGINSEEAEFICVDSIFPSENRPFIYTPVCSLNYKNMDENLPKIGKVVAEILDVHKDEKGIIHTISYKNAQIIYDLLKKYQYRLYIHNSKNKLKIFDEFYNSENGVLLSPIILEGLDLKDDLSRFQIFIKVPFLSLGDKSIKTRMKIDNAWYVYKTLLSIIQGAGRSIRSEDDYAVTYMLDSNFGRLIGQYSNFLPKYFKDSIVRV